MPINRDWTSYEPIAETYATVAEPVYFTAPADDLVSLLHVSKNVRLLDIGAGTGAVASAARRVTGEAAVIVATDPIWVMLRHALSKKPRISPVGAALPQLPFHDGAFQAVTAAFVLSHLNHPLAALREMARLLTKDGQVGLTSWATSPAASSPGQVWESIADGFMERGRIQEAVNRALPAESQFANPEASSAALSAVGLTVTRLEQRTYRLELPTALYAKLRAIAMPSRFIQSSLPAQRWREFLETASSRLHETFGPQVEFDVVVNFAIATRAS